MNYRKDIYEKVKFMLKDNTQVNINCSKLARQYGCDRRTVSKAINSPNMCNFCLLSLSLDQFKLYMILSFTSAYARTLELSCRYLCNVAFSYF